MKILLTGAAGFTGRHFARIARAAGHDVIPLVSDLLDATAIAEEVGRVQPEWIVHLAAISFVGHEVERAFYDVNVFGTLNLLAGVKECRSLSKLLVASSANIYGNTEASPIRETQPPAPVNHYAASKTVMEFMLRARAGDAPLVITRPFNYTGVGQSLQFVIPKLVDHFRRRATTIPLGNLDVEREYNDVRFVCAAYLRLLESPVTSGTFNVCTGVTYPLRSVLGLLEELSGHEIQVEVTPSLVRANEIRRLCGDPALLQQTIGDGPTISLRDTLSWMLASAGEVDA
ncbi:MAG: GDP-mannose 4,6-dehydratase [Burkholderiales bacterium]|nr:GDP-mannose 4,6-dehydratase [Burkholderiales bacterium]